MRTHLVFFLSFCCSQLARELPSHWTVELKGLQPLDPCAL